MAEKTTKVTFTQNVDHYVRGDVHELTDAELKRVDEYATRYKVKSPYTKGDSAEKVRNEDLKKAQDAALPSRTTNVTAADGRRTTAPNRPTVASDATTDSDTEQAQSTPDLDEEVKQDTSEQTGDPATDEGGPTTVGDIVGEGDAPDTTDQGNDSGDASDSDQGSDDGEGNEPAADLPAQGDKPVQGQGSTPRNATRKPASK